MFNHFSCRFSDSDTSSAYHSPYGYQLQSPDQPPGIPDHDPGVRGTSPHLPSSGSNFCFDRTMFNVHCFVFPEQVHGVSISYSPPVPSYDAPQQVHHHHHHDIPVYHPFDPPSVVYRPGNSFVESSDIFFKPVNKKRPPRRNQKKFPYRKHVSRPSILHPNPNSVAPETTFHFVDDIDARPPRNKVKRFPAATSNNLDVNRPGQGIVSLLKREDLTVMAALLEETDLYRSIDKQG